MNNIFNSLKPSPDLSRNAFDKSQRDVFSTKNGILTPCLCIDTVPDSVYDVNMVDIVRTDSIQSAPFARMSQNTEYFFVPYSQIYRDFDRLFYERGDSQRNPRNASTNTQSTHVPYFSIKDVLVCLFQAYIIERLYIEMRSSLDPQTPQEWDEWYSRQKSYYDYVLIYSQTLSFENFSDIHGRYCVEDMLRNLDLLGYGNFLPAFKSLFVLCYGDVTSALSLKQACYNAFFGQGTSASTFSQACESYYTALLGSGYWTSYISQFDGRYLSVFHLAAYLKVWSDYYRNAQYDVNTYYGYYFNYDYAVTDQLAVVGYNKIIELLKPRYRQYKKDVFTGSYPTAQFGSVAVAMTENPVEISSAGSVISGSASGSIAIYGANYGSSAGKVVAPSQVISDNRTLWNVDASVSALSIRQALALQRYKERILRAGNRANALQKAVFGDSSRYISDEYADFIGAVHSPIDFNSVPATAETGDFTVGELASNGISTHGGSVFKYNCHDHGIILGLFYVLPESEYDAFGVDRFNTMTESYDFFKPDLQNLGLAPVFNFDFNYQSNIVSGNFNPDAVLGYLARYWQYKSSVDKVHGEFYGSLPFSIESLVSAGSGQIPVNYQDLLSLSVGSFADYVIPRNSQVFLAAQLKNLYVAPNDIDRIFYVGSDETQSSDKFKVNMSHEVKCVLPMSVIGLPL